MNLMSSVWWIANTGHVDLSSPRLGAKPTDLNPRRSAGTERFLGEEIAQTMRPREVGHSWGASCLQSITERSQAWSVKFRGAALGCKSEMAATPSAFLPSVVSLLEGDRMARDISDALDFLLHLPNQFLDAGISL